MANHSSIVVLCFVHEGLSEQTKKSITKEKEEMKKPIRTHTHTRIGMSNCFFLSSLLLLLTIFFCSLRWIWLFRLSVRLYSSPAIVPQCRTHTQSNYFSIFEWNRLIGSEKCVAKWINRIDDFRFSDVLMHTLMMCLFAALDILKIENANTHGGEQCEGDGWAFGIPNDSMVVAVSSQQPWSNHMLRAWASV